MWHGLVWGFTAVAAGLWSLVCWGVFALLTGPDWTSGGSAWWAWLERWQIPVAVAEWLPMGLVTALKAWLTAWGPSIEALVMQLPGWLGWLSPLVVVGWLLGLLMLAMVGAAGSVLVVALRGEQRRATA
jgi:hypothetical protein